MFLLTFNQLKSNWRNSGSLDEEGKSNNITQNFRSAAQGDLEGTSNQLVPMPSSLKKSSNLIEENKEMGPVKRIKDFGPQTKKLVVGRKEEAAAGKRDISPSGKATTIPVMSRYKSVPSLVPKEAPSGAHQDPLRAAQF